MRRILIVLRRFGFRNTLIWNSVFTSFVEHVLMKLGEAVLGRQPGTGSRKAAEGQPGDAAGSSPAEGTDREIRARRRLRGRLGRRGLVYYALMAVTLLMELDLWLFGRLRSGSYFIVVEKPADGSQSQALRTTAAAHAAAPEERP